jgi:CRISPR-associated protein Csm1
MIDRREKEYNSVVLAALLHDIGKLLHRSKPGYDGKHAMASGDFLDDNETKCKLTNELYDLNLVEWLVRFHHPPKEKVGGKKKVWAKKKILDAYSNNRHTEQEIDRIRLWSYMKIVRDADSYSCAERDYGDQKRTDADKRTAPLDSIFESISIVGEKEDGVYRYPLNTINPLSNFPKHFSCLDNLAAYIGEFKNAFPDLTAYSKLNHVLSAILSFLERYTWCVPSDTRYRIADISLFDHLRSSAAIAACLYKRHYHELDNADFKTRSNEFILIAGDFSGIQNYIFEVTNKGSGGAAKRLRARSFFIQIFCEVTVHKILHALELPLVCNLFSAGGKFILLAPSGKDVEEKLIRTKAEIQEEIHRRYFNQFSFLMAYRDIENYRPLMDVGNFCHLADEMFHLLETEKIQNANPILVLNTKHGKWNETAFRLPPEIFEKYVGVGDCKICGKGPGEFSESAGIDELADSIEVCAVCRMNRQIGEILPQKRFVAFGKGKAVSETGNKIVLFHETENSDAYYVHLSNKAPSPDDYYLIWNIGRNGTEAIVNRKHVMNTFFANHVLTDTDGTVMSFEQLSQGSRWKKEGDSGEYGIDLLGVLKVDADNMGLVFSKGFDEVAPARKEKEKISNKISKLEARDLRSVSRFLTLSRMIDLFFSGWVNDIMDLDAATVKAELLSSLSTVGSASLETYLRSGVIDFNKIYTVYSGGDDMVLIGPWETMIMFAILLNAQFREYTCQSKSFTLSAGLTFVKPKYPVASAIREAETLLQKSKEEGKNRITLFGTTIEWESLPRLIDFFLFLNERLNDSGSSINSAFLYRLLEYHRIALSYFDANRVEGLRYLSAVSYDIGRNIVERDKEGNIIQGREERKGLQSLLNDKPDKQSLIYNVKVPLFWALYRNRGVRNEYLSDF